MILRKWEWIQSLLKQTSFFSDSWVFVLSWQRTSWYKNANDADDDNNNWDGIARCTLMTCLQWYKPVGPSTVPPQTDSNVLYLCVLHFSVFLHYSLCFSVFNGPTADRFKCFNFPLLRRSSHLDFLIGRPDRTKSPLVGLPTSWSGIHWQLIGTAGGRWTEMEIYFQRRARIERRQKVRVSKCLAKLRDTYCMWGDKILFWKSGTFI